jgi:hypothetical protein
MRGLHPPQYLTPVSPMHEESEVTHYNLFYKSLHKPLERPFETLFAMNLGEAEGFGQ